VLLPAHTLRDPVTAFDLVPLDLNAGIGLHDQLRRTMRIEETLGEIQGRVLTGPVKTKASRRTVSLGRTLAGVLEDHLAIHPPDPQGLVFTAPEGGALRHNNFRRWYWIPAVRASVGQPCRVHDLRHSHAAMLIAQGVHPKVLQERLGHASIRTTLDVYGHLWKGLDEAAAVTVDAVMAPRSAGPLRDPSIVPIAASDRRTR
jgi:integrase